MATIAFFLFSPLSTATLCFRALKRVIARHCAPSLSIAIQVASLSDFRVPQGVVFARRVDGSDGHASAAIGQILVVQPSLDLPIAGTPFFIQRFTRMCAEIIYPRESQWNLWSMR